MRRWVDMIVVCALLAGCGGVGGTESGNPDSTRQLTGTVTAPIDSTSSAKAASVVASDDAAASDVDAEKAFGTSACVADTVVATAADAAHTETSVSVNASCQFTLSLVLNQAYTVSLHKNGSFLATLQFTRSATAFEKTSFIMSSGLDAIDLGRVAVLDSLAAAEFEPAEFLDQDGDGTFDFADSDDDNDGTTDDKETDCDLDGVPDDHDGDVTCVLVVSSTTESDPATIIEVTPTHDESLAFEELHVEVDTVIAIRLSCAVDLTTVTDDTIQIVSSGDSLNCSFMFPGDGTVIECHHSAQPMQADTTYTATFTTVKCSDGRQLPDLVWNWHTR